MTRRTTTLREDDRAVSIAITHVLAIGITTLLMSALLVGASGVLQQQKERAAQRELKTIGNRVATQITAASALVNDPDSNPASAEFYVQQPTRVSGGTYTIALEDGSECGPPFKPPGREPDKCLKLETTDLNVEVEVPVDIRNPTETDVDVDIVGSGEVRVTAEQD